MNLTNQAGPQNNNWKGGQRDTPEYEAWVAMRKRCTRRWHKSWPRYGGRGIAVCERWSDFLNFLADMGRRPSPEHSLDRIDNDGNYEPSNCRWATAKTQRRNSDGPSRTLTAFGKSQRLADWCVEFHVHPATLASRLRRGVSVEDALTMRDARGGRQCPLLEQCHAGHAFDQANTYLAPDGRRACRACMTLARQRFKARRLLGAG